MEANTANPAGADAEEPDDAREEAMDAEFDWRGWVLVAVLAFAFVLAPLAITTRPFGLTFRQAYLVLPLVPAFLLGIVAVWATARG